LCVKKTTKGGISKRRRLDANKLLELVHIDIWGLAKAPSFGGTRYFIVMTFLVRECYGSPKKQEFLKNL
jgi:hypothetical protein